MGLGAFEGLSLGSLVRALLYLDPSIVVTALLGTAAVFAAFSAAALVARRRSMLYLGAIAASVMGYTLMGAFVTIFLPRSLGYAFW
jgi:FtsH-binding integral membrane protein